jgi:hypothetical protein
MAIHLLGMWGVGDVIHQRAIVREAMKAGPVWLNTSNPSIFHDLIAAGLNLSPRPQPPRIRETSRYPRSVPPPGTPARRINYIDGTNRSAELAASGGTLLSAMFKSAGIPMPDRPDFSMPVPQAWRDKARALIPATDKPIMVYRPVVHSGIWSRPNRSPDTAAYAELYQSIRDKFFVISLCDLNNKDVIVGGEQDVDLKFHRGELDFETMAGLFAEADLVFGCAGFAPILAQAVGTPVIIVYGGNESFKTTNSSGVHLAPTLPINPINPCDCHNAGHRCDKRIDVPLALDRIKGFVMEHTSASYVPDPKILIVGTTWVNNRDRAILFDNYMAVIEKLNPNCDLLIVDAPSPRELNHSLVPYEGKPGHRMIHRFDSNIGHLMFHGGGRDGWGRAFCFGLDAAVECGYDYVAHIEGDSLCRLDVMKIAKQMEAEDISVASVPASTEPATEVETGLMVFNVAYLAQSGFTRKYNWPVRHEGLTRATSPEKIIRGLLGPDLRMMDWKALRGDGGGVNTITARKIDWITHTQPRCYASFMASVMTPDAVVDPRVLLMATTYIPDEASAQLFARWLAMAARHNPTLDILLVNTPIAQPIPWPGLKFKTYQHGDNGSRMIHTFRDNIGHLNAKKFDGPVADGWGRAFAFGLNAAISGGYDYVACIEGDAMCRVSMLDIARQMRKDGIGVAAPLINSGRHQQEVETGFMVFDTEYVTNSDFIARYNWPSRKSDKPLPERIVTDIIGADLHVLPLNVIRGDTEDKPSIHNACDFHWITHCEPEIYEVFLLGRNMPKGNERPGRQRYEQTIPLSRQMRATGPVARKGQTA